MVLVPRTWRRCGDGSGQAPGRSPGTCPWPRIGCSGAVAPCRRARLRARGARGCRGRLGRTGAARSDRDGRGGRRRAGRPPTPGRPGRHRHRQVPGLSRAGPAPRRAGGGRDRDPGAPAPARRARHPASGRGRRRRAPRGRHVVRRAQRALQLRLPAPDPRGGARRAGGADRGARGLARQEGARAAVVGGEGGGVQGQRRARPRPASHRPRVAAGQRQPPRLPRRLALPVRRGVLRRAGPREGPPVPPDRHQPLPARDRRDRGCADDPRLRRGRRRRGPRGGQPGHAGGHRRTVRRRGRPRRPAFAALGHRGREGVVAGRRPRRRR